MRNLLTLLILFFTLQTCPAQQIEIMGSALLECEYYKRMVTDTLHRENDFSADNMILRIGKEISMFYNPKGMKYDSLGCYNKKLALQMFMEYSRKGTANPSGKFKETVYKNYPAGKMTVFNHFALMHWTYTEEWEKPRWELIDSTQTILEYPCQLAKSCYRGRIWYAWFTFDIPISEGPWKLCGLPGLILEAYDMHQDYLFTAVGIRLQNIPPVGIYNYKEYNYARTTRQEYLQMQYKEMHTDQAARATQMYDIGKNNQVSSPKKTPHRNYELEETDYHK